MTDRCPALRDAALEGQSVKRDFTLAVLGTG